MITSPIDLFFPYQRAVYDDTSRWIAWLAGRQVGKSFTGAGRGVKNRHVYPKTDILIASPSERQSLEAVIKCRDWVEAFDLAIAEEVEERDSPGALVKSNTIIFPNGSRVIAVPGKPDTVRGFSADVWLDEFAFFEDPQATWKAILPSVSNPLKGLKNVLLTSTPNGKGGRGKRFYDIVTANGTINPEGQYQYKAGVWSIHRTPITYAAQWLGTNIEELKLAIDDDEAWKQEFLCQFIDGSTVLLPYDVIGKCESAEAMVNPASVLTDPGIYYAGIDFGRDSDPTVMWILEAVGDVLWTRGVIVFKAMNTVDQFEQLLPYISRCTKVCVDYTGPGVGFGDMVQHTFGAEKTAKWTPGIKAELCQFTVGFKQELFPRLRSKFDEVKIRVPVDVDCREDLHEMEQVINNGNYNYFAKRTAEGHSDRCTALALAVRASGAPSFMPLPKPFSLRNPQGNSYSYDSRRI